jgi:hypothetical protein
MKALEIQFDADGAMRFPNRAIEGSRLVLQNVLVNLMQGKDGDPVFTDRGVEIVNLAAAGALRAGIRAQQEANFAANDLLFFSREWETAAAEDKPATVQLTASVEGDTLDLLVALRTVGGQNLSFPIRTT